MKPSVCAHTSTVAARLAVRQAAARAEAEAKPKIDWSRVSKPGDVLKAIPAA